jgi:hypothetical protein
LHLEQLDKRIEIADIECHCECAADRGSHESGRYFSRLDYDRPTAEIVRVAPESEWGRSLSEGVSVAAAVLRDGDPVNAGLVSVAKLDFDYLRFDDYLSLGDRLDDLEVFLDMAQLFGHSADDNDSGLRVDHNLVVVVIAYDLFQRLPQFRPEVGFINGLDTCPGESLNLTLWRP